MNPILPALALALVPDVMAAQAEAEAAGTTVYVDYVLPGYDYRFNVAIPEYGIAVPYSIYHQSRVVKLTLAQAIAREEGRLPIRIPYSATQFPVRVPHTGEVRYCSLDSYMIEL